MKEEEFEALPDSKPDISPLDECPELSLTSEQQKVHDTLFYTTRSLLSLTK